MITIDAYWMGRDSKYRSQLTDRIRENATVLLELVNELLEEAKADGVKPGTNPATGTAVSSGWRPAAVNDSTANAAKGSKHLTGHGIDIRDTPDRAFARWCLRNKPILERLGLYMEDPRWTPTWVHLQDIPPGSGNRVFVPSTAKPLAQPLPEQA